MRAHSLNPREGNSIGRAILQMKKLRLEQVSPCPELQKLAAEFRALVFLTSRPRYLMISSFYFLCNWIPNNMKIPTVSQNKNLLLTRRLSAVPAQGFRVLQRMGKKQNLFSKNDKRNEGQLSWDGRTTC